MTYTVDDLLTLMARLREPVYGCPWDLKQHYGSIAPSTIEEAYEVVDAIERASMHDLREELGDLLFQVVFYARLGDEDGHFDFADIVDTLVTKLIRRHPHVFPDGTLESRRKPDATPVNNSTDSMSEEAIKAAWEKTKQKEREGKGHRSVLDDIPITLPAVNRAVKLQKRASNVGFDWPAIDGVYAKLNEETQELKEAQQSGDASAIEDELGDLLFTVINLARHLNVDPEAALRRTNSKFKQRFQFVEQQIDGQWPQQSTEELDELWQQSKQ